MSNPQQRLQLLEVAVPVPLRKTFQYLPNDDCRDIKPGCRLLVPFGTKTLVGIFLGFSDQPTIPTSKLRAVIEVIDETPVLSGSMLKLCLWSSEYYHHPIGDVVTSALPVLLRKGKPANEPIPALGLSEAGLEFGQDLLKSAPRQKELFNLLASRPLSKERLKHLGISASTIRALVAKQLACWQEQHNQEQCEVDQPVLCDYQGIEPNEWQQSAIDKIKNPGTYLIYGITGSGKTEVYLRIIESALKQKKQALVLVPEIGLTPQILNRFENRFGLPVTVIHSALTDRQRLLAFRAASSGQARIIIGTRSAVFVPMKHPGVIIIDEEHDSSFKQQDGFRYSARDIAVMRGQMEKLPVILGSATPSLESFQNCQLGKYQLVTIPHRPQGVKKERYQLISLRNKELQDGFASELIESITTELEHGNQVLVFINRRGFAPVLYCSECQWIATCRRCDARMTCHLVERSLMCHHCGTRTQLPSHCSECQSTQVLPLGLGTQRVEESLKNLFPSFPVLRVDRDSTRKKGALEKVATDLQSGEPTILVGTQMLAKGHHFPDVTLVVLLDIDSGFYSSDFKSLEKTGQLILQVGGRAGRAAKSGKVILQSQFTDHPLLQSLIKNGYKAFSDTILEDRKENRLPPFSFHCLIRAASINKKYAMEFLDDIVRNTNPTTSVETLGPIPALMEKRAGRYRSQLLIESQSRTSLHQAVSQLVQTAEASRLANRVRWSVDVDPVELF